MEIHLSFKDASRSERQWGTTLPMNEGGLGCDREMEFSTPFDVLEVAVIIVVLLCLGMLLLYRILAKTS
ncbi:hypothetical protein BT69DRAFT_334707 [Atractiella rhizophila]|nr:hypothetical protein BT69DRAFT_334707 [Atractiella rhizophila]